MCLSWSEIAGDFGLKLLPVTHDEIVAALNMTQDELEREATSLLRRQQKDARRSH